MRTVANSMVGTMLAAAVMLVNGCAGDQPSVQESVASQPSAKEDEARIPDMPGNSGETKEKPAGQGDARAPAAPGADSGGVAAPKQVEPGHIGKANKASINIKAGEATVQTPLLNIRSGPANQNPVKRTVKGGEKLVVKGCKLGWCEVGDGEWVYGSFLKQ